MKSRRVDNESILIDKILVLICKNKSIFDFLDLIKFEFEILLSLETLEELEILKIFFFCFFLFVFRVSNLSKTKILITDF